LDTIKIQIALKLKSGEQVAKLKDTFSLNLTIISKKGAVQVRVMPLWDTR